MDLNKGSKEAGLRHVSVVCVVTGRVSKPRCFSPPVSTRLSAVSLLFAFSAGWNREDDKV